MESESFIDKMGHHKMIRTIEDSLKTSGNLEDLIYFVKKVDKKVKVINLSIKHQIIRK